MKMNAQNIKLTMVAVLLIAGGISVRAGIRYVSPTGNDANAGTSWAAAKLTVQAAVATAVTGDTVLVTNGVYALTSAINITNAIVLTSVNGSSATILDGQQAGRCVLINGFAATVNGFTLRNGRAINGGGVYCNGGTVTNCVITNNQAVGDEPKGGGVYCDGGTVSHCVISGNSVTSTNTYLYGAFAEGGGIYAVNQSQIDHSTVINNSLTGYYAGGGGINANNGSVVNCTVSGNTAYGHWYANGGGVYMTANVNGLIRNSLITGNNAHTDRGSYTANAVYGGGVHFNGGGILESSTIYGNSIDGDSSYGGGLSYGGLIGNTIIYGNSATARMTADGPNYSLNPYGPATFDHCCSTPQPAGVGNIASAPGFMSGGYRLDTGSPCIDTGTNQAWMATATDLDGNPRIANGIVDMGAFEVLTVGVLAPQLTIIRSGASVILTWPTNAAFSLQSAAFVTGAFTNVPGATSPYTNFMTGPQQYFRLQLN
jgi:hypothetical protein